jgi:hypothetical protein
MAPSRTCVRPARRWKLDAGRSLARTKKGGARGVGWCTGCYDSAVIAEYIVAGCGYLGVPFFGWVLQSAGARHIIFAVAAVPL